MPSSRTRTVAVVSSLVTDTVTVEPSGEYFIALATRFVSTCWMRRSSHSPKTPASAAEHDAAAVEHRGRRTQDRCSETEDPPLTRVDLDVGLGDLPARADRVDDRHERLSDLARRIRPLLETLPLEGLTEDEARAIEAKKLSGSAVEPHDRAARVHDEERVVHAREDGFELQGVPL